MKGFQTTNDILQKVKDGFYDEEDLIELSPFNPCIFAYTMLKLPFNRFSPQQEYILDTFYDPKNKFKELLLSCGRKGGKTTISSMLLLYEVYKILVLHNDPQEDYGLMPKERIYFMLIGPSKEQSQNVSFDYVKTLAKTSPYLRNFISNETNEELVFEKNLVVRVQTSSSRGGRGFSTMLEIFDEIAHFIDNRGNLSGTELYYALIPNLKPLAPDSRSMLISSPAGKQGIFWEQFRSGRPLYVTQETPEHNDQPWRAVFQYPTWSLNPKLQFNCLGCPKYKTTACSSTCTSYELSLDYRSNPEKFEMEYGAQFCDTIDAALSADKVRACATGRFIDMKSTDKTTPRVISLDPAMSGNSYALTMGHLDNDMIIVDLVKNWQGTRDLPVKISMVEEYVEDLYKRFNVTHIIIDQFQSASTVQRLQERGVPVYMVHVTQQYNKTAYEYFINRINMEKITYPEYRELLNELVFLQCKRSGKSTRYEAALGHSDDLADAMARMVYVLETEGNKRFHVGWGKT